MKMSILFLAMWGKCWKFFAYEANAVHWRHITLDLDIHTLLKKMIDETRKINKLKDNNISQILNKTTELMRVSPSP